MPRRAAEPEVVDPGSVGRDELAAMRHVHDEAGNCLKNDAGRRCGTEGRRRPAVFTGRQ